MKHRIRKNHAFAARVEQFEGRCLLSFTIGPISQDGDFVGPDASVGPDGIADVHVQLADLPSGLGISSADITGLLTDGGTLHWRFGDNPQGFRNAEVVRVSTTTNPYFPYLLNDAQSVADLYLSPPASGQTISQLTVTLNYEDPAHNPAETRSSTAIPALSPDLAVSGVTVQAPASLIPIPGGLAHFVGQYTSAGTNPVHDKGDVHVSLDSLPAPYTFDQVIAAYLSDGIANPGGPGDALTLTRGGSTWSWNPSRPSGNRRAEDFDIPLKFQIASSNDRVDLSFPPIRDESGTTMTLRLIVRDSAGNPHSFYTQFTAGSTNINLRDVDYDRSAAFLDVSPARNADQTPRHDYVTYTDASGNSVTTTLQALLNDRQYPRIHLNAGTYYIDHASGPNTTPLRITRPVQLDGDPAAVLLFTADSSPPAGSTTRPTAYASPIFIHSSHVTLSNFKIRFQNPATLGGAVIASDGWNQLSRNRDGINQSVDITLDHLDVQGPRFVIDGSTVNLNTIGRNGVMAQALINLGESSGVIQGCTLRGGGTVFSGGPWVVINNDYIGTVPTSAVYPADYPAASLRGTKIPTWVDTVFASFVPHDQLIANNHASLSELDPGSSNPIGSTYRFLFYAGDGGSGYHNVIRDNVVDGGIGRRADDETTPAVDGATTSGAYTYHNLDNNSEIFLTEDYLVLYEGRTLAIGPDRRVLSLPSPDTTFYRSPIIAGDIVSILTGPDAGHWYRIAQVLDTSDFLMDQPLPAGDYRVSVARGLVDLQYDHNTVDLTGTTSTAFNLVGNLFNVKVINNRITGDATTITDGNANLVRNVAIRLESSYQNIKSKNDGYTFKYPIPNNSWTHDVIFGAVISDNQIEGVGGGVIVSVNHEYGNSSLGRTYLSAEVTGNRFYHYGPVPNAGSTGVADPSNVLTIGSAKDQLDRLDRFQVDHYLNDAILDGSGKVIPNADPSLGYSPSANDATHIYRFADPNEIRVTLRGNWYEPMADSTVGKNLAIISAVVNGAVVVHSRPGAVAPMSTNTPSPLVFRFGEATSVPGTAYRGVSNFTHYSTALGYGFTSDTSFNQNALSIDRATGLVYASRQTFQVDLPNGSYLVSPTIGPFGDPSDRAVLTLQGVRVGEVSSVDGVASGPYVAVVVDGHLTLKIESLLWLGDSSLSHLVAIQSLKITPLQFDFGPGDQVETSGYSPVYNYSEYDSSHGFGWQTHSSDMNAEDRGAGAGTSTNRDDVYASSMTFQVALPNGTYDVAPTLLGTGDASDRVSLALQGLDQDTIPTGAGPVTRSYVAVVRDGFLRLKLDYAGGVANHKVALAGLTVAPRPDAIMVKSVVAVSDATSDTISTRLASTEQRPIVRPGQDAFDDLDGDGISDIAWFHPDPATLESFRAHPLDESGGSSWETFVGQGWPYRPGSHRRGRR